MPDDGAMNKINNDFSLVLLLNIYTGILDSVILLVVLD